MIAATHHLILDRAATWSKVLTIRDNAGDPVDVSAATFFGQIRREFAKQPAALFAFAFTTDGSNGEVRITFTAAQSMLLKPGRGVYEYDIFMYFDDTAPKRLIAGKVTVAGNISVPGTVVPDPSPADYQPQWGDIGGTLSDQEDLQAALDAKQAADADLTSWAGVTRAAGFDAFAAAPTSANLATLVTDDTGTGSLVFGELSAGGNGAVADAGKIPLFGDGGELTAGALIADSGGSSSLTMSISGLTWIKSSGFQGATTVPTLTANRAWEWPDADGTVVTHSATQTLSNKTFVAPVLGAASATSVTMSGFLTTDSKLKVGSLELQPFSLNNGFLTENAYHNGSFWLYRATGAAGVFYFNGPEGQFRFFVSGTGGTGLPGSGNNTQFKVHASGAVALGSTMNSAVGDYTGATLIVNSTGSTFANGPVVFPTYTVGTVPSAATFARGVIYVSNESGGAVLAFSDGTNWRRVTDRNIIS